MSREYLSINRSNQKTMSHKHGPLFRWWNHENDVHHAIIKKLAATCDARFTQVVAKKQRRKYFLSQDDFYPWNQSTIPNALPSSSSKPLIPATVGLSEVGHLKQFETIIVGLPAPAPVRYFPSSIQAALVP